jgi:hypothetical protein
MSPHREGREEALNETPWSARSFCENFRNCGGLVKNGKMLWVDVLPVYGPADSRGQHVPREYRPMFVQLQSKLIVRILENGLLSNLRVFVTFGKPAQQAFDGVITPAIRAVTRKDYSELLEFAVHLDHPSLFLKASVESRISLVFMLGIAEMNVECIGQGDRIGEIIQNLTRYAAHEMSVQAIKEVNKGMSHRGGKVGGKINGPKTIPFVHATKKANGYQAQAEAYRIIGPKTIHFA